ELQSLLGQRATNRRLERLAKRRPRRVAWHLHGASRRIVELLVAEGIGTLCIGKNPLWKPEALLGRRNHHYGVSIPHARFIEMLAYKAELVGIQVCSTAASSTSTVSFLDGDPLPVSGVADVPAFSGRRLKRGRYRAADGRHLNADVNGSYHTIRKRAP